MIQLNLLPDVKLEYMKVNRTKRLIMTVSFLASLVAVALFVGLFVVVNVLQKQHIGNLDTDIQNYHSQLLEVEDLAKVITVQNQLINLPALHEQKPAANRTLDFLIQLAPANASVADLNIDFASGIITASGSADSLVTVNKFADTLKFTNFTTNDSPEAQAAFSEVVLSSFGVDDQGANYQIDFKFNADIFNNNKEVKLSVPNIISTRSQTQKPDDLFQESTNNQESEQ